MADDDEAPEGVRNIDLAMQLGHLTMQWPHLELCLFLLFAQLLGGDIEKCRVIWFNIVSLDMRLKLMSELKSGLNQQNGERLRQLLAEVRTLSLERNKLVHWTWMPGENNDWHIQGLRSPDQAGSYRKVSGQDVSKLVKECHRIGESAICLKEQIEGRVPASLRG